MNSSNISATINFTGNVTGTASSATLNARIAVRRPATYTQQVTANVDQLIDKATASFTLAAGATLVIDLVTGQTNPLNESITGADAFAKIRMVIIEHSLGSLSSGVTAFGSGSNQFQGPLSASATVTLAATDIFTFGSQTAAGWTVDGTHKTIQIVNNDGTNAATLRVLITGCTA